MNAFRVRHLENCLCGFEEATLLKQPLDLFLQRYFRAHKAIGSSDRAWICDNVYEMVRWKGLIDYLTPPPTTWPNRLRTYIISDRWRGHTKNASISPHTRCSFPKELFSRIEMAFGTKKAMDICNILNEPAPTFLRVNTLKISRDRVYKYLLNKAIPLEKCQHSPYGLVLSTKVRLLDLPEYKKGYIEIQDEASQLVAFKVQVQPGEKVLDYCAGSGGKSLAFGPQMENCGKIYLHDTRDYLLRQAKVRMRRAGIQNYVLLCPRDPLHTRLHGLMDWVVVDVPCSGTGALRRNPDIKWNYSDKELFDKIGLQREIFEKAIQYLKPHGKVVYITCSILDEENVQQVKYFCQKHSMLLSDAPFHALPQSKGMDGFFCATLERK